MGDITAREYGGSGIMNIPSESGGAFCWQFTTGVDFDITPEFGVGIGYKYFATNPTVGDSGSEGMYADFDYKTSIITLGFTYTF